MNDEPQLEHVTAEIITQVMMRREEICAKLDIGDDMLEICLQWEIIQLPEPDSQGSILFPLKNFERLQRGIRLHRDLEINWQGVSVALGLLERIEELEQHVHLLSNHPTHST